MLKQLDRVLFVMAVGSQLGNVETEANFNNMGLPLGV
jgi:hypothetical protein